MGWVLVEMEVGVGRGGREGGREGRRYHLAMNCAWGLVRIGEVDAVGLVLDGFVVSWWNGDAQSCSDVYAALGWSALASSPTVSASVFWCIGISRLYYRLTTPELEKAGNSKAQRT